MNLPVLKMLALVLQRAILPTCTGIVVLSALSHLVIKISVPPPARGLEETVVEHQTAAARKQRPCDLLLFGDSSCLMNISAEKLETLGNVLNVGTVSIIPFSAFAELVASHSTANPGQPKYAVLFIHPEMLGLPVAPSPPEQTAAAPVQPSAPFRESLILRTGIRAAFERGPGRAIPHVLPGRYATFYGFDETFRTYLKEYKGSAVDPNPKATPRFSSQTFAISEGFRNEAQKFKAAFPPDCKLFFALSPIPESLAPPNYDSQCSEMISELEGLIKPHAVLHLPHILPDIFFSSNTHLRPEYKSHYTRVFVREFLKLSAR